ncbi:MAG: LamB/YcsF family protein [Alicyclobacillus macrosporangiidus]|uniref:LamB/YcsF family protein n=1 Tax=Alicyclobacillus macrosporangiidus TaxID=392015 RepID=UPI0026F1905D|nr:5-oxoprolinase subunit PxpA [Alicyclobacillus macrosporangiidus]MCL6599650.1 LamB/YcsF family protein [Alicyclobacillus macrosporangiidus]
MYRLDMNCDLGESFGAYKLGNDEQILDVVTSCNIACGFHAGDAATMRKTVAMALEKGVAIGAHPGLQDLVGFGRRNMDISPQEAYDIVVYQIGALYGFVRAEGGKMQHVKAHGALYNMAAVNAGLAEAIAEAVYKVDPELILFGLSGSELVRAGQKIGLRTASEVFADRTYQQDGTLTPRRRPDAMIQDTDKAVAQVIRMVKEGKVRSQQGVDVAIQADTVCIHGDGPHALEFARHIKQALTDAGITVQAVGRSA